MWSWDSIIEQRKRYTKSFKNFLVFDIETVKDSKMFQEIANEKEKQKDEDGEFLSIPFHRVVSLSYMIIKNGEVIEFKSFSSKNEEFLLQKFWEKFTNSHNFLTQNGKKFITSFPVLITINGKDFDMPVIKARTLKYVSSLDHNDTIKKFISIFLDKFDKWEDNYPRYTNKYTPFHIDIPVDILGKKMSLKNLCYLCSIPVKQEGEGSKVEEYFNDGNLEKIAKYCGEDVKATAMLFSYINTHFLLNAYPFPSLETLENLEPEIIEE